MLRVENLTFSYNKKLVLKGLSFDVKPGENLAIMGESGTGKSTLLKLMYGEFDVNEGTIFWNDKRVLGPKFNLVVGYDFMKYVSQEFDLMPFTSVAENIGKYVSNFFPDEKKARVNTLLEVVALSEFSNSKVKTLSGGQKQRVTLAQALAKQPEVLLLDEPFSHIDNFKKQSLRRRIFKYLKDQKITCIVATHDKEDVLGFADKVLVLNETKIVAMGRPEALYKNPKTSLIASFFGEFNEINNRVYYTHQIKAVKQSKHKARVKNTYFKGHYYLIEALLNEKVVFFEHKTDLKNGETIYLKIINTP